MPEKVQKTPIAFLVLQMIRAFHENDKDAFYRSAKSYSNQLSESNRFSFAIKKILDQQPAALRPMKTFSGNLKDLVEELPVSDQFVYVTPRLLSIIKDIESELNNWETLVNHNLSVRNKLLLYGPTGTGKTTIAKEIASKLKIPFINVNISQIVKSHIGQTSISINEIFTTIQDKSVLFIDEIDSLAIKRSSNESDSATNEYDRIVNSLLVNIDKLSPDVILIAATNRLSVLDSAFVRRFDIIEEIGMPDNVCKQEFFNRLLEYHNIEPGNHFDNLIINMQGSLTFADIKKEFTDIARKVIIGKINS